MERRWVAPLPSSTRRPDGSVSRCRSVSTFPRCLTFGLGSVVADASPATTLCTHTRMLPTQFSVPRGSGESFRLHDLQGDIVGTVGDSESETKLLTKYNSTEFGVPTTGSPPKYSWLGATGASSELSSGTLIEGTVAYQPQLGRALQTQAIAPPGEAINGAEGQSYHAQLSAWSIASANEAAARHVEEGTAEEKRKAQEAQEAILRQCQEEGGCGAPSKGNYAPGAGGSGGGTEEPPSYCLIAIITEQEAEGCGDGGDGGYECSGDNACAAAPCANGDNPHSNHCGAQLPGRELCSPLQQGCRVSTGRLPNGTQLGKLQILSSPEGPLAGCIVGGVVGGTFAVYSTAGLAAQAGATGGCFVGGGLVIIAEHIF